MTKTRIWVHKRHADYPTIQVGFRHVSAEVARKMIAAGCAQSNDTDQKRLKYVTEEVVAEAPAPTPEPEPAPESKEAPEPERAGPPKKVAPKKRRTYKRRDMTAES